MELKVDLYWSFRSPYSYIVLPRIMALRRTHNVTIELRVVHPNAIRNPAYFARMDLLARPYFLKDSARAAAFQGMSFRRPVPDPIAQDTRTLAIAAEQPLARRLGRLGIAATARGRGLEFCAEVANLLWDGSVTGWDEGAHLANAAARAGLDLAELETAIANDPDAHEVGLAENDGALRASGHWGVPMMVFDGEPFFGQDRFDVLEWRLQHRGLEEREPIGSKPITKLMGPMPDATAPDGSEVRLLPAMKNGGMAHFSLGPRQVSKAVAHRTVEEIWYFVRGRGRMWRQLGKQEETVAVFAGVSVTIPTGTRFQFRSDTDEPLEAVAVTMPPWPGPHEALLVQGTWEPTV
jgi:mannose-6-phosphate isomerase-like protein (cupin superfamily)